MRQVTLYQPVSTLQEPWIAKIRLGSRLETRGSNCKATTQEGMSKDGSERKDGEIDSEPPIQNNLQTTILKNTKKINVGKEINEIQSQ